MKIIDYKPEYLSKHYRLDIVGNPKYDKPFLKQAYLLAKLPGRLQLLPRKKAGLTALRPNTWSLQNDIPPTKH